jgi:hypothetical protein
MFSKVFARGAGKAAGTDYLMSEKDAQGKVRNIPAEVMRGDPKITKQIISRLNFAQNYKSGVLSFTETVDEIGRGKLGEIMDSFEEMVKAGFEDDPGRIDVLWVLHQDKGRAELHWVIPNVDLETGKRFQPYFDRVDQKMFRAWERLTNTENGFTDPADPARARTINIPAYLPENKEAQYRQINDAITGLFAQGQIKNRDDVVKTLTTAGYEINRLSRDYLSIKDPNGLKLRLKGAFYGESFTSPASIERYAEQGRGDQSERLTELRGELEGYVAKRRDYVRGRYCQSGSSSQESDRGEVQSLRTAPIGAVSTIGSLARPVFEEQEYEVRSLQPESLAVPEIVVAGGVGDNWDVDRSRRVDFGLERDDHQAADRGIATEEQRTSEESRQPPTENRPAAAENQEEELTDDRTRNNAVAVSGTTEQRSPGERSPFDQAIERLEHEVQRIDQASTDLDSRTAGLPIIRSHLQRAGRSAREIGQGIQSATARNQRTSALLGEFAAGSDQTRTTIQTNQQHHANIVRQHQEVQRLIELAAERAREKEEQAKQKEELARDLKMAVEEARAKAPVVKVIKTSRSQGHGHSM